MLKKSVKYVSIILMTLVTLSSFIPPSEEKTDTIQWISIQEALELSQKDQKPIFVDVYTDWCGWCKVMDKKTFNNDAVAQYVNENYYAVKLNPEKDGSITYQGKNYSNASFAKHFDIQGYPTILLLSTENGAEAVPGYQEADSFLKMLEKFKK